MTILDSNVWIAFFNTKDSQHEKATEIFLSNVDRIAITQDVIIEVVTILLQKTTKATVNTFIDLLLNNSELELIYTSKEFVINLLQYIASNDYTKIGAVDHSLVLLSKNYKIITFDKELKKVID